MFATLGGLGERLPAPGTTVGSLVATLTWWLAATAIPSRRDLVLVTLIATVIVTIIGLWACGAEAKRLGMQDPQPVVIDEVAGQWLCLLIAAAIVTPETVPAVTLLAVAGFLLFRLFDVVKPPPVGSVERIPGGLGIVADDLVAGALAGLILGLCWNLLG
jgi:phosphatidylglycerophosphatase A